VASLSQGRTAAAQCGLFTHKSVPVIFEPPCTLKLFSCMWWLASEFHETPWCRELWNVNIYLLFKRKNESLKNWLKLILFCSFHITHFLLLMRVGTHVTAPSAHAVTAQIWTTLTLYILLFSYHVSHTVCGATVT